MHGDNRPVFLNLLQIRMPIAAVMSIMHRISGVFLVLLVPVFLYWLQLSVSGVQGFSAAREMFVQPSGRIILFLLSWTFSHHFLAGVRYLIIDMDTGVDKQTANRTAWAVILLAPLFAALMVFLV